MLPRPMFLSVREQYFSQRAHGPYRVHGSSFIEGGPGETGTEGIFVKGRLVGVRTSGGPLDVFQRTILRDFFWPSE